MIIIKNLVSSDKYSIKCPYNMKPEFIVVHNTANDAPAENEIAYMLRNNNEVSFHYAIDDKKIIQGIPEDRNAWHAGDGGNGNGNRKGIAIEICYSKSGGERFDNAEKLAAKFIAAKLKEKGWGIDKVKKHQDFSNKYCPHRTLDMGWERFIGLIKEELDPVTTTVITAVKANSVVAIAKDATYYTGGKIPDWVKNKKWIVKSVKGDRAVIDKSADGTNSINSPINVNYLQIANSDFEPFLARVNTSALNIRKGPGTNYAIVGTIRDKGTYTIVEQKGTWGKLKSGAGWISLNYCIRK
jgi:N-acetylmuramoyl-L-alanine amidase CwlA